MDKDSSRARERSWTGWTLWRVTNLQARPVSPSRYEVRLEVITSMETRRTSSPSFAVSIRSLAFLTLAKTAGKTECHSSCNIVVSSSTLL